MNIFIKSILSHYYSHCIVYIDFQKNLHNNEAYNIKMKVAPTSASIQVYLKIFEYNGKLNLINVIWFKKVQNVQIHPYGLCQLLPKRNISIFVVILFIMAYKRTAKYCNSFRYLVSSFELKAMIIKMQMCVHVMSLEYIDSSLKNWWIIPV